MPDPHHTDHWCRYHTHSNTSTTLTTKHSHPTPPPLPPPPPPTPHRTHPPTPTHTPPPTPTHTHITHTHAHSFTHRHNIHIGNGLHLLCIAYANLWDPQCTAQVCPACVAWPTGMTEVRRTYACCSSIHAHTVDPLKEDVIMTSLMVLVYMYSSIAKECRLNFLHRVNEWSPTSLDGVRHSRTCFLLVQVILKRCKTQHPCSFASHFCFWLTKLWWQ